MGREVISEHEDGHKKCKNCVRWYSTGADQCEIPNPGIRLGEAYTLGTRRKIYGVLDGKKFKVTSVEPVALYDKQTNDFHKAVGIDPPNRDEVLIKYLDDNLDEVNFAKGDKLIYGHPSKLNKTNSCPFYKSTPVSFFTLIWRNFKLWK